MLDVQCMVPFYQQMLQEPLRQCVSFSSEQSVQISPEREKERGRGREGEREREREGGGGAGRECGVHVQSDN